MARKQDTTEAPKRSPDCTPLPGGGCWRWDESAGADGLGAWVDDTPAPIEPTKE